MHHHDHTHSNSHGVRKSYNRAFVIGILLNATYIIIEIFFGLLSDSLALLADAGHNLSDVLGLMIAWIASYLIMRKPTAKRTYGLKKSSILAALINSLILLVAIGGITWEALGRIAHPREVDELAVIIVAGAGVIINTFTALLFIKGKDKDLNIKGAFLHMTADAAISLGVVVSGIIMYYTSASWLDPILSIAIVTIIFIGTWNLLKESINLVMDAVPDSVNQEEVREFLQSLEGVQDVHDLHIWAMSTTETALTVHLAIPNSKPDDSFINSTSAKLHDLFGIHHTTIQIENGDDENNCNTACCQ